MTSNRSRSSVCSSRAFSSQRRRRRRPWEGMTTLTSIVPMAVGGSQERCAVAAGASLAPDGGAAGQRCRSGAELRRDARAHPRGPRGPGARRRVGDHRRGRRLERRDARRRSGRSGSRDRAGGEALRRRDGPQPRRRRGRGAGHRLHGRRLLSRAGLAVARPRRHLRGRPRAGAGHPGRDGRARALRPHDLGPRRERLLRDGEPVRHARAVRPHRRLRGLAGRRRGEADGRGRLVRLARGSLRRPHRRSRTTRWSTTRSSRAARPASSRSACAFGTSRRSPARFPSSAAARCSRASSSAAGRRSWIWPWSARRLRSGRGGRPSCSPRCRTHARPPARRARIGDARRWLPAFGSPPTSWAPRRSPPEARGTAPW